MIASSTLILQHLEPTWEHMYQPELLEDVARFITSESRSGRLTRLIYSSMKQLSLEEAAEHCRWRYKNGYRAILSAAAAGGIAVENRWWVPGPFDDVVSIGGDWFFRDRVIPVKTPLEEAYLHPWLLDLRDESQYQPLELVLCGGRRVECLATLAQSFDYLSVPYRVLSDLTYN